MSNVFKSSKGLMLAGLCIIIIITAAAWQTGDKDKGDSSANTQSKGDTTEPRKRNYDKDEFRMKDLDEAMQKLDEAMKDLDLHLKDIDVNISKEINEALAKIDFDKIGKDVEAELKNVDFDKINEQLKEELKNIDLDKIKIEVNNSLKDAQEEIKKIDMDKIKNEIQEMQLKINSDELKQEIDDAMKGAKKEIEKATESLRQLKEFTDELQKDGLIDKKKGYTIEWKNDGELYINGQKQSKDLTDKYKKYYKKDGYKIVINANEDKEGESL